MHTSILRPQLERAMSGDRSLFLSQYSLCACSRLHFISADHQARSREYEVLYYKLSFCRQSERDLIARIECRHDLADPASEYSFQQRKLPSGSSMCSR